MTTVRSYVPLFFPLVTNSCSESAPLLPNSHEQEDRQRGTGIGSIAHEPLTSLTKILLVITLFLLLLSSVCLCRVASLADPLMLLRSSSAYLRVHSINSI